MKTTDPIDTARVELLLGELRLPAIKLIWPTLAAQADKEGWPAARFLAALAEHEMVERDRRRAERHLNEARLPPGKTIDTFDFDAVPMVSRAQVTALAAGDAWLEKGANLLLFGGPGGGKNDPRRRSVSRSSRTAGECCLPEPPISSSDSRPPDGISRSKAPSPSLTSTIC